MSCVAVHPITPTSDADVLKRWRRWLENAPAVTTSGGGGGGRVLLISYIFPPTGGSGAQRPAKLAKYLPQCGWTVEVLCAGHDRFPWHDPTLMANIPPDCRVHRVPGYEPACVAQRLTRILQAVSRWLPRRANARPRRLAGKDLAWYEDRAYWRLTKCAERVGMGDGKSLWIGPAVRAALRLHRQNPFDVIVSTGPPRFVHRIALRIARRTGLPWVADVRDPFVSDLDWSHLNDRLQKDMIALEQAVLENATATITTCDSLATDLHKRYPDAAIRTIPNGFDRGDILRCTNPHTSSASNNNSFTLTAIGSFYGYMGLSQLIHALQQVLLRHPEWRERVRLTVAGSLAAYHLQSLKHEQPEWVTFLGYLDHAAVIDLVRTSACTALILPNCNGARLCLPSRMFELIALPTHLLALVPPGSETERVLITAGGCTTAPYEEEDRVISALEQVISNHFAGRLNSGRNWSIVDAFDRRRIAAAWADCLNAVRP